MPNLKQARKTNLDKFIKEHEADPEGDLDKLDAFLKKPYRESESATPPASSQGVSPWLMGKGEAGDGGAD